MADDANAAPEHDVDGGEPTAEEARLTADLAEHGDDAEAPAPAAGDAADAAAVAKPADPPPDPDPDPDPEPAPAPVATPAPAPEPPQPPRDFDAAHKANQEKFDAGEIDGGEFQAAMRTISREEAQFEARKTIFEENQRSAAEAAQRAFVDAAATWEAGNKEFMGNALRAKAMQDAINAIDKRTPGLPPAELLKRAAKDAFEVTNYTPPAPAGDAERKAALAAATAARKPGKVPVTIGSAPTAGALDAASGSGYAALDALDIDELENRVAGMRPDELERYLRDAPGADTRKT